MNAVIKFAKASLFLLSASFYLVVSAELAKAQAQIYLCDGVYRNRPCAGGEEGQRVQLPGISRYDSRTADARNRSGLGYARGRLGSAEQEMGEVSSFSGAGAGEEEDERPGTRGSLAPSSPARSVSSPARVRELGDHAAYLRSNINRLIEQDGAQQMQWELNRLAVALDNACNWEVVVDDEQSRRNCDGAQRDLVAARGALPILR